MQQLVRCPHCGNEGAGPQFCTTCGERLPLAIPQEVWEPEPAPAVKPMAKKAVPAPKYGALRAVATVYRVIGWVIMLGGTLFSIALAIIAVQGTEGLGKFIPWGTSLGAVGIAAVGVIASILYGLFLIAFADLCYVLIDIESNTRSKE